MRTILAVWSSWGPSPQLRTFLNALSIIWVFRFSNENPGAWKPFLRARNYFYGKNMLKGNKLCYRRVDHQLLVLRPHPIVQLIIWVKIHLSTMRLFCLWWSPQFTPENIKKASLGSREKSEELKWFEPTEIYFSLLRPHNFSFGMG